MNPFVIGGLVALCAFAGALIGMLAGRTLPQHHLSSESKDVIKVAMAMMATISALVVSLLISTAKTGFDTKDTELRQTAADIIVLDRILSQYGPEAKAIREYLRLVTEARMQAIWAEEGDPSAEPNVDWHAIGDDRGIERLQDQIFNLQPKDERQQFLKTNALRAADKIAESRWLLLEQMSGRIQWPFLAVLVFWLTVVFISFGVFAPRNASVIAALFVCALSVGGALYMIVEMDEPYSGYIRIPSEPFKAAINQLGK